MDKRMNREKRREEKRTAQKERKWWWPATEPQSEAARASRNPKENECASASAIAFAGPPEREKYCWQLRLWACCSSAEASAAAAPTSAPYGVLTVV